MWAGVPGGSGHARPGGRSLVLQRGPAPRCSSKKRFGHSSSREGAPGPLLARGILSSYRPKCEVVDPQLGFLEVESCTQGVGVPSVYQPCKENPPLVCSSPLLETPIAGLQLRIWVYNSKGFRGLATAQARLLVRTSARSASLTNSVAQARAATPGFFHLGGRAQTHQGRPPTSAPQEATA
jgi:hypothetical protein